MNRGKDPTIIQIITAPKDWVAVYIVSATEVFCSPIICLALVEYGASDDRYRVIEACDTDNDGTIEPIYENSNFIKLIGPGDSVPTMKERKEEWAKLEKQRTRLERQT